MGNCEEAFNFYKSVFGGEFSHVGRFSDMPPQEDVMMTEREKNKIMHIALPISKETILMGSDTWQSKTVTGNNVSISVSTESKEDADKYFNMLSDGGKITIPMNQAFWGEYFGIVTDKYCVNWRIIYKGD